MDILWMSPHVWAQSGQWFGVPVTITCPLPVCPTPLNEPLPMDDMSLRGCDRDQEWVNKKIQELLSHPTFISRAGFQHQGKEGTKEKGACKQKGDMTLPRSTWDSELLHNRGRTRISLAPSVFPFVLCPQPGLCRLFVLAQGQTQEPSSGIVLVLFRNSCTHQPLCRRFPF